MPTTRLLKHRLVRVATGAGAMRVIALLSGLGTSIILARYLGPEKYGTYGLVVSIATMAALCLHAGMPAYLVREIVRLRVDRDWPLISGMLRRIWQWILLGGVALIAIFALMWGLDQDAEDENFRRYLLIASPMVPLIALNSTRAALLRAFNKVLLSQVSQNLVQPLAQLAMLSLIVLLFTFSLEAALLALVVSSLISVVAASLFLQKETRPVMATRPQFRTRAWLSTLLPFSLLAIVSITNGQISVIVLGWLSSSEEISYLRIADRISQLVVFSLLIVNLVIAPNLAERAKTGSWEKFQNLAVKSARGALLVALPIVILLVTAGHVVIGTLFGEEYAGPVWLPMIIMAIGQFMNVAFGSVAHVLNMAGYEKITLRGLLIGLASNLAITSALAGQYGAVGAAWGFSISLMLWNTYLAWMIKKTLDIRVSAI